MGSAARDVITDTCTDKIIEDKKKDGVTFENLLQSVVSEYKWVYHSIKIKWKYRAHFVVWLYTF